MDSNGKITDVAFFPSKGEKIQKAMDMATLNIIRHYRLSNERSGYGNANVEEQVYHYNHENFEENKTTTRATFFAFESPEIEAKKTQEGFKRQRRDGNSFCKDPKERPTTFQNTDFDDDAWKTIPVPANWEVEGYDYQFI
ncbi:hypothetical protein GQR58_027822 [Nymphon striatum]|nr:hypothetical protein GQR58_027822 [Nymphon striatum]